VPQPAITQQIHASWPFKLTLEGTYHNLGIFFDKVSKFPRLINISGVTIKARTQQQANATVTAECTATTFVLLEAPVGTVPGAPGAAGAAPTPTAPAAAPAKR
jgi:type IV pilus assembly protein PilO